MYEVAKKLLRINEIEIDKVININLFLCFPCLS